MLEARFLTLDQASVERGSSCPGLFENSISKDKYVLQYSNGFPSSLFGTGDQYQVELNSKPEDHWDNSSKHDGWIFTSKGNRILNENNYFNKNEYKRRNDITGGFYGGIPFEVEQHEKYSIEFSKTADNKISFKASGFGIFTEKFKLECLYRLGQ